MKPKILLVEDEEKLRRVAELHLRASGYEVEGVATAESAVALAANAAVVVTDYRLPGINGLDLLACLRRQNSLVPVIMVTAYGSVEHAVEAMKAGAFDYLPKPYSLDHLTAVVEKALEVRALRDENLKLKEELGHRYELVNVIGRSDAMQEVFAMVMRVAPTRTTVLLAGESGVGKDLIARAIHYYSPRRDRPFVKINCTALPENLMESELFGYEKGAFTGAVSSKAGKFEHADTGTVFLDEIGDVPPAVQVKLLRVLQERDIERLGSNKTRRVDVRVIAATNVDLRQALENGTFREDLYYRLNVLPMDIPPLRHRREDIEHLARHFAERTCREMGTELPTFTPRAMSKLLAHSWPGNVRELENVIERSIVLGNRPELDAEDIRIDSVQRKAAPAGTFLPEGVSLDEYENAIIREALRRADGNKSQAARLLGITRNALRYRLSQMGIEDASGA